jgi:hypothetical protein
VRAIPVAGVTREANEPAMSANVATRLRALARDHQEGRLTRDAYRKLRAPLIDALDSSVDLQSSTIPHLEPRARGARVTPVPPEPEVSATAVESAGRSRLARVLARVAAVFRR